MRALGRGLGRRTHPRFGGVGRLVLGHYKRILRNLLDEAPLSAVFQLEEQRISRWGARKHHQRHAERHKRPPYHRRHRTATCKPEHGSHTLYDLSHENLVRTKNQSTTVQTRQLTRRAPHGARCFDGRPLPARGARCAVAHVPRQWPKSRFKRTRKSRLLSPRLSGCVFATHAPPTTPRQRRPSRLPVDADVCQPWPRKKRRQNTRSL